MSNANQEVIYTSRLMLRPFDISDANEFYHLCNDKDVMKYIGDGSLPTINAVESSIARWIKHYKEHGYSLMALELQESNKLIGFCGLITQKICDENKIELGYRLGKESWLKGYATEAALMMRDRAFTYHKIKEIISIIQPGNVASINIAKKLGMVLDKETIYNDKLVNIYKMLRDNYLPTSKGA